MTELELYTYPEYKLWYNMKIYSPADSEPLMNAVVEVQKAMETDDRIGFFFIAMKECFVVGLLYRSGAPNPGVYAAFDGITAVSERQPPTIGTQSTLSRLLAMPGPYRYVLDTLWGSCSVVSALVSSTNKNQGRRSEPSAFALMPAST